MEIKKLQAGGYLTYQPLPIVPRTDTAQGSQGMQQAAPTEDKKESYVDNDLIKQLLGKGITVDVMQYSNKMDALSQEYENMSSLERNTSRGMQIRSQLKGDMGTLNALIQSKTFFDKSIETAKSNKSLDELAVNGSSMFVKNAEGKISNISFADYAKNKDKYKALTNAELAEQREFNKDLTGNTSIYSTLNYGRGMELIKSEITTVLANLGTTEKSVSNGSFQIDSSDVAELKNAAAQGVFKIKTGESIKTNSPQLEKAKQAMWLNLQENSKNVLRARAASIVDDPSKIEATAMTMAVSLLDPAESISTSKTYDMSGGKGGSGAGGGSNKNTDIGGNEAAFLGISNQETINQIADYGVSIEAIGNLIPTSTLTNDKGDVVKLRNNVAIKDMGRVDKAFTADGKPVDIDETAIIGSGYYVDMIVTSDGNGGFRIDEEGNKKLAEFNKELSQTDGSALKVSELRQKYGINSLNLKKMIVAEAASYDKDFWGTKDSRYFKPADASIKTIMEGITEPGKGSRNWLDHNIYKHLIFIPANDGFSARRADKNSGKIPESAVNFGNSYNTGNNGMRISEGTGVNTTQVDINRTDKYFENKK